ncbi:Uncharacterised protein [Serratia fonticola]|uniref:Uncharacterized protein n=1 Tax=Serratia fonticola TaxID=47917 RepID=A0A4V6KRH8_SERFO|nr:Uncharacterised protein [Serratia fonticola]
MESKVVVPAEGKKITVDAQGKLVVPHNLSSRSSKVTVLALTLLLP